MQIQAGFGGAQAQINSGVSAFAVIAARFVRVISRLAMCEAARRFSRDAASEQPDDRRRVTARVPASVRRAHGHGGVHARRRQSRG
jgi:hypothetical protein